MRCTNHNLPPSRPTLLLQSHFLHNMSRCKELLVSQNYLCLGLDILNISRVGDNIMEPFAISVCNTKCHKQCPTALDIKLATHWLIVPHTSLICRYKYMVMTTFSMDGKAYEIEVEGEPTKDVKGAKDSAAMQALVWFENYGFDCW